MDPKPSPDVPGYWWVLKGDVTFVVHVVGGGPSGFNVVLAGVEEWKRPGDFAGARWVGPLVPPEPR